MFTNRYFALRFSSNNIELVYPRAPFIMTITRELFSVAPNIDTGDRERQISNVSLHLFSIDRPNKSDTISSNGIASFTSVASADSNIGRNGLTASANRLDRECCKYTRASEKKKAMTRDRSRSSY